MGAAKNNPTAITSKGYGRFDASYQADAEQDRGLHHAIAFERITGWPVHATYVGDEAIRFHNEDGSHWTFDVRGMMTAAQHSDAVTQPIVLARRDWPRSAANADGYLEIGCICLGEEGLATRGVAIDPGKLAQATATITANTAYLALVPTRPHPRFPASALHRYAFGKCVVFADALAKVRGLPAMTMLPEAIADWAHIKPDQMQHAVVQHPDGDLEDVWGKVPAPMIARRYGITAWRLGRYASGDDGRRHCRAPRGARRSRRGRAADPRAS